MRPMAPRRVGHAPPRTPNGRRDAEKWRGMPHPNYERPARQTVSDYHVCMPNYRRAYRPGGTFFLTLVTENRMPLFGDEVRRGFLRAAIRECRDALPFTVDAIVLLP